MVRRLLLTLVMFAGVIATLPVVQAQAQDGPKVVITEVQLNKLAAQIRLSPKLTNVTVDIAEGRITLSGTYTESRLPPLRITLVIVPDAANGQITWSLADVLLEEQSIPAGLVERIRAAVRLNPAVSNALRAHAALYYGRNILLTGVGLSGDRLTLYLQYTPGSLVRLTGCTVTTRLRANLRATPGTLGTLLAAIPGRTTLTATARYDSQYAVRYNGKSGWLRASQVTRSGGC